MRLTGKPPWWPPVGELVDRRAERRTLDLLVQSVRGGDSRTLVIHGEPGIGKTALLDYLDDNAQGCRVERIAGFQSEMELPYASVQQLCAPFLDRLERLPSPQRDALETSFGLSEQPPSDRFLVGLAVLDLLADAAEEQPLLCLVDDQHWLDFASAQVLSFVARRLGSESLGIVFSTRVTNEHLAGLPELEIGGLPASEAAALLDSVLPGKLDPRVRDQIVAETRGNPLALLELTREMTPAELAFGLELPGAVPLSGKIEESFRSRVVALPDEARVLLVLAASEPTGDPVLVRRAADILGVNMDAQQIPTEAGLIEFGERVRFRHPLARSAAYSSGSMRERHRVHQALADVTDPALDPERYAWHRAQACEAPSEEVADQLAGVAQLALARGCLATAGAYLQRAVALSVDPARRTDRAISAAEGKIRNGAFDTAIDLLAIAQNGRVTDLQQARIDLVRAQLAHVTDRGGEAPSLLLKAAKRLEAVDVNLARATYLDALSAAVFAGRFSAPGGGVRDVAQAAAVAPPATGPILRTLDLLLDSMAASYAADRGSSGVPSLREALSRFGEGMGADEELRWIWMACLAAMRTLDDRRWDEVSTRHVQLARGAGALSELPLALNSRTFVLVLAGNFGAASALADETEAVQRAIGSNLAPYGALALSALRGETVATQKLVNITREDVSRRGEGIGITIAEWAWTVLHNGQGDYDEALVAATNATEYEPDLSTMAWPIVELIEAASRAGESEPARAAYRRLSDVTAASGTDWALGLDARSCALLTEDEEAEKLYRQAIDRLGRTRQQTDLARAHLLYGEWLRRQRRRSDSREQLVTAERMFHAMGMEAFATRAVRELRTTGETARKRMVAGTDAQLTPQEVQVARLARDGLSNPEIGVRLFISRHTVQYHLRKVFAKLGITSRAQLDRVLPPER
jgi:DNA-binding CsgD family transcriptional regulator/tetratricopeptide (TPR) repeat protein